MSEDESICVKLAQAVEKYPVLYDFNLPGHSNKDEVAKAWNKVAKEINLNVIACKEKWRNCRNSWARYLRKTPSTGSSTKFKKPYYLAGYLSYLTPFTKARQCAYSESAALENLCLSPAEEDGNSQLQERISEEKKEEKKTPVLHLTTKDYYNKLKKRKRRKSDDYIDKLLINCFETRNKRVVEREQENSDLMFFKSLLPDVSRLTPAQKSSFKLFVQQKLHHLLYNPISSSQNVESGLQLFDSAE